MTMKALRAALAASLILAAAAAGAVEPDEVMKDPALEARARSLSAELRCMVCQNQSIDDSAAPLARDIRVLIRERIAKGDSNAAVPSQAIRSPPAQLIVSSTRVSVTNCRTRRACPAPRA